MYFQRYYFNQSSDAEDFAMVGIVACPSIGFWQMIELDGHESIPVN